MLTRGRSSSPSGAGRRCRVHRRARGRDRRRGLQRGRARRARARSRRSSTGGRSTSRPATVWRCGSTNRASNPYHGLAPAVGVAARRGGGGVRRPPGAGRLLSDRRAERGPSSPTSARWSHGCSAPTRTTCAYINVLPDFAPARAARHGHLPRAPRAVHGDRAPAAAELRLLPVQDRRGPRIVLRQPDPGARHRARATAIPFLLIVQAMPHGPYRDPTEAEIAWQVNHALAFGARGISYFAYWTPVHVRGAEYWRFRHGLIENGRPTEHYAQAARLNATARAIAGPARRLVFARASPIRSAASACALPFGPLAGSRRRTGHRRSVQRRAGWVRGAAGQPGLSHRHRRATDAAPRQPSAGGVRSRYADTGSRPPISPCGCPRAAARCCAGTPPPPRDAPCLPSPNPIPHPVPIPIPNPIPN